MAQGGARIGAGRKTKADEERLRDKLSPWVSTAIETVVHVMQNAAKESDRLAAAKLIIEYECDNLNNGCTAAHGQIMQRAFIMGWRMY